MNVMSFIKPISVKLQRRSIDIVNAYQEVEGVIDALSAARESEENLHAWYLQAEQLAAEVDVVPSTPRTAARQGHRENVEHSTVEEYYRRAIILPLLDHILQQMRERFSKSQIVASRLLHLIPSVLCAVEEVHLDDVVETYKEDLPNHALVTSEIWRWRTKWNKEDVKDQPSTLQSALLNCDPDYFPNIHTLLRIVCTLPVTSCENERANSVLKNLKTYLRNSMGEERMSALALMKIHYSAHIDLEDIVERFKAKCNRRILL